MVQPDGYHDEEEGRPATSRAALITSGLVLMVAASLVITWLTESGTMAAETTTTTTIAEVRPPLDPENFTIAAIETGRPLQWEPVLETRQISPIGLVAHESRLYLFATHVSASHRPTAGGGGLIGWVSERGAEWEPLGELIDRSHIVTNVVSTSKGLVALGAHADGGALIWIADSALEWRPSRLPVSESSPHTRTWLSHAAATGDRVVAMGSDWVDPATILGDVIPAEIASEDLNRYGVGWLSPRGPMVVHGPLGLVAHVFTAEELGMTPEDLASILGSNNEPSTPLWSTEDGVEWEESVLEVWGVQNLFSAPDGSLRGAVWGNSGLELWSSTDGVAWETGTGPTSVDAISLWGDSLVAVRRTGAVPDLALSSDGTDWEPMGVEQLFPKPSEVRGLQWSFESIATGRAGVAFVALGWQEPRGWIYEPMVLTKDGHTLTIDEVSGRLVLDDGVEKHRWSIQSQATQDDIAVDLAAETITITHPDSGEMLLTLSFEDIDRATALQSAIQQTDDPFEAFVFTADGEHWMVDDLSTSIGEHRRMADLEVTDSSVVALIGDDRWRGPDPFGPTRSGTDTSFEVWLGLPPPPEG